MTESFTLNSSHAVLFKPYNYTSLCCRFCSSKLHFLRNNLAQLFSLKISRYVALSHETTKPRPRHPGSRSRRYRGFRRPVRGETDARRWKASKQPRGRGSETDQATSLAHPTPPHFTPPHSTHRLTHLLAHSLIISGLLTLRTSEQPPRISLTSRSNALATQWMNYSNRFSAFVVVAHVAHRRGKYRSMLHWEQVFKLICCVERPQI